MEEKPPTQYHFVCLPHLNLGDCRKIDLGFATVWNFDHLKEEFIPDEAVRNHVTRILEGYKNSYPSWRVDKENVWVPARGIGLISTGSPNDQPFSEEDLEKVKDARLILFICFLSRRNTITRNMNTGHSMASSENFAPVFFSAVVDSEYWSEHNGFVVPSIHGGLEISKTLNIRPRYISSPRFDIEADLFNSLVKMRSKHKRKFRNLMSAVEVFYESFYNSSDISHNARILLQASAFEILMGEISGDARKEFKNYLKSVSDYPEDRRYRYASERRGGKREIEIETKKVMWADRFFSLRNHIAHGHVPKAKEYYFCDWQRHFDIALYFFVFCLKRKVEEAFNKDLFDDDVEWNTWEDDLQLTPVTMEGFEYDHYGRRGWERLIRKTK